MSLEENLTLSLFLANAAKDEGIDPIKAGRLFDRLVRISPVRTAQLVHQHMLKVVRESNAKNRRYT